MKRYGAICGKLTGISSPITACASRGATTSIRADAGHGGKIASIQLMPNVVRHNPPDIKKDIMTITELNKTTCNGHYRRHFPVGLMPLL